MRRTVLVWLLFLFCLLLLSLAATPYSKTADLAIISIRLAVIAIASILAIREWWRYRHSTHPHTRGGTETLLARLRRWYYGGK